MASNDAPRDPLPFEPKRKRKQEKAASPAAGSRQKSSQKKSAQQETASSSTPSKSGKQSKLKSVSKSEKVLASASSRQAAVPEVVSRRMLRRMMVFSGIPTALGVSIFFLSYVLLTRDILDFPKYVVLFTTLGCFGLGVVGLSYGALSASWDEERLGNWFGLAEFKTNFGRMTEAWRTSRQP